MLGNAIKQKVTIQVRRVITWNSRGYLRAMSHLKHAAQKRLVRLVLAGGLLTGAIGTPLVLTGGTAQAVTCNVGSACALSGQLNLTAGLLSLTTASALGWTGQENGSDLNLV